MKMLQSASSILFSLLLLTQSTAVAFASDTHENSQNQSAVTQEETHHSNPRLRLKYGTALNWAGYALESSLTNPLNNAVSDVKGSWTIPAVTCTGTNTYSATWLGIDGYSDGTVEQTGTEQDCVNGQPRYSAWYEMYPHPSYRVNLAIHANDVINAEMQYVGNNNFLLTLTNQTTGKSFTTKQRSNGHRQSAEWIIEAPWSGSTLPLANFGTQNFTNAAVTLNGVTGTISSVGQYDPITMTNSTGSAKATPSGLANGGSSFSVQWVASN